MGNDIRTIVNGLNEHWQTFSENHIEYEMKGKKASAARARKAIGELRKLVTPYRKALLEEVKSKGKKAPEKPAKKGKKA